MAAVMGKSITVVVATPMLDATKEPRSHSGGLQMRSFDTGRKPLTQYLIRLVVSPEVATEDACKMEHDISVETFEAIKRHASGLKK